MRAEDLRAVLLVKAVEEADRAGTLLTPADRASAARAARREHRESNHPHTLLAVARGSRWIGVALVGLAAAAGFALSALDGTQRVNILGFPVLGLVLWNLAAYVLLAMRPSVSGRWLLQWGRLPKAQGPLAEALASFLREWSQVARPLYFARASRVLHLAALALALALIGGLYLRGLVLEYQAVWASTFLDASQVHQVVSVVYGPASLLTGVPIPGVEALDAIRARRRSCVAPPSARQNQNVRGRSFGHTGVWLSSHIRASLKPWRRLGLNGTQRRTRRTKRSTEWSSWWRNLPSLTPTASSPKTTPTALRSSGTTASVRSAAVC